MEPKITLVEPWHFFIRLNQADVVLGPFIEVFLQGGEVVTTTPKLECQRHNYVSVLIRPASLWNITEICDPATLPWGTYGKSGKDELKWTTLGECDTDHLIAILGTQPQITWYYEEAIKEILNQRKQGRRQAHELS